MLGRLLARLTYAKVTTVIAVTLALAGGGALAAGGDADKVNGIDFKKFEFRSGLDAPEQQILKAGDLRMRASCTAGVLDLQVSTLQNNASYYSYGSQETDSRPDFDTGTPENINAGTHGGEVDAVYQPRRGRRVGLQFLASDSVNLETTTECLVVGFAFAGNGTSLGSGSAGSVDGVSFQRFDWADEADSPVKTISSVGDLDLNAECTFTPTLDLRFITRQSEASIFSYGAYGLSVPDFDEAQPEQVGPDGEEDVVYEPQTGPAVASQLLLAEGTELPDPNVCMASGIAMSK